MNPVAAVFALCLIALTVDLLIVGSMGAYTYSESTRFNGFDPPKFIYID